MKNKSYFTRLGLPVVAAATFTLPFSTPSAAALVTVGDHASLFFNGSATIQANDNIFLDDQNEESDILFILAPGLELNIGTRANANINIRYREDFHRYSDNSGLDSNYSNVFLSSYWSQPRLDLRLNGSYQELAQPTPELVIFPGQLIERDETRAGIRGEYDIGERTSASLGFDTTFVRFQTEGFVDRDTYAIPVNFYYALTPLVDLSLGYRFRHTDTGSRAQVTGFGPGGQPIFGASQSVADYRDHYFNVGARGELTPKLLGEARVGYQQRNLSGGQTNQRDTSGVSFGVDLSYFTTPRTTFTTGLLRDYQTGSRGGSINVTGGSLGIIHNFSHLISAQGEISYTERKWEREAAGQENRKDELLSLSLGTTYSPTNYLSLSAGYTFRTNDSNIQQVNYDNHIFSVSAGLRY